MKQRPYQQKFIDSVFTEWEEHQSTLGVMPTGAGKTIAFAGVVERVRPRRSIILCNREELVWQAREKIAAVTGLECSVEMAELQASTNLFNRSPVVVATVQTLISGDVKRRMERFNPMDFGCVIVDECFPSGTPVDGRPIESIKPGDRVRTHLGYGTVTNTSKRKTDRICVVTFDNGETLVCTPGHPIWTTNGFCPAEFLTRGCVVATITPYEQMQNLPLRNSRRKINMQQTGVPVGAGKADNGNHPSETRREFDLPEEKQRNETTRGSGACLNQAEGDGVETNREGREWAPSHNSRASDCVCTQSRTR